ISASSSGLRGGTALPGLNTAAAGLSGVGPAKALVTTASADASDENAGNVSTVSGRTGSEPANDIPGSRPSSVEVHPDATAVKSSAPAAIVKRKRGKAAPIIR